MSRATQYADSNAATINSAKDQIAWLLQRRTSPQAAISSQALADAVGLKSTTVRDIIKELRAERNLPITSCPGGYYLIDSVEQLERELESIQEEIQTRKETKQELVAAFNAGRYDD